MDKKKTKPLVLQLQSVNVPSIRSKHYASDKWVKWGNNDEYMEFVLDLYNDSPTHRAIIKTKANMIIGKGFSGLPQDDFRLNPNEPLRRTLKKISRDYALHNGFALQIIWGKGDKIAEVRHLDFSRIRAVPNPDADPTEYKYSRDWSKWNQKPFTPTTLPIFNPKTQSKDKRQIYYFYEPEPGVDYYPVPTYNAGFMDIEFEHLYSTFKANTMKNGMFPSLHVMVMSNPADPEKDELYEELKAKFGGAEGAGSIWLTFADTIEEHAKIEPIQIQGNSGLYDSWKDDAVQGIVSAHQLTSPVLAGLSGSGNLAGNANEINTAWEQFQTIYVNDKQESVVSVFKEILPHWSTGNFPVEDLGIMTDTPVTNIPDIAFDVAEDEQVRQWITNHYGLEFDQEIIDAAEARRQERQPVLPNVPIDVLP